MTSIFDLDDSVFENFKEGNFSSFPNSDNIFLTNVKKVEQPSPTKSNKQILINTDKPKFHNINILHKLVTFSPAKQSRQDDPYIKKICKHCSAETIAKEITLKCRRCNRCNNCSKDLKSGGGRHRLCPLCLKNCFDHRDNRLACQTCVPSKKRKKI